MGKYTTSTLLARQLLAVMMAHLVLGDSTWVIVNATHGASILSCSLCSLLGFKSVQDYCAFLVVAGLAAYIDRGKGAKFEIMKDELGTFCDQYEFGNDVVEVDKWRGDIVAKLNDERQTNKHDYTVMRCGVKVDGYAKSFGKQTVEELMNEPPTQSAKRALRKNQREFIRGARPLIADVMTENPNVYVQRHKKLLQGERWEGQ